jgi:hypothetical protein
MINLLRSNEKFVTVYNINVLKAYNEPQCTLQLVCEDRVFLV